MYWSNADVNAVPVHYIFYCGILSHSLINTLNNWSYLIDVDAVFNFFSHPICVLCGSGKQTTNYINKDTNQKKTVNRSLSSYFCLQIYCLFIITYVHSHEKSYINIWFITEVSVPMCNSSNRILWLPFSTLMVVGLFLRFSPNTIIFWINTLLLSLS